MKKYVNIALWIVITLIAVSVSYAIGLVHWILGTIILLLFMYYVLRKIDNQNG